MKRLLALLFAVVCAVSAHGQHTLDSVEICALLHPDGHAYVQEERTMVIGDEGTECYITFNDIEGMDVSLVGVTDESGREYVVEPEWDVDRSRQQKAGRCGMVRTVRGYELCWGVGTSGRHKYKVIYNLSGLVGSYTDSDGFNYCFYEAAKPAAKYGSVYIMVFSRLFDVDSLRLTPETARVWAFGFHGRVGFYAGCVAAYSKYSFSAGDNITVMMEFPKGIFAPTRQEDTPFSFVKEVAFKGSDYNLGDSCDGSGQTASFYGSGKSAPTVGNADPDSADDVLSLLLGMTCCCGLPVFLLLYLIIKWGNKRTRKKELERREKNICYVYEPPLKGRLVRSQLIVMASLRQFGTQVRGQYISQRELLQAFVLRMLYSGRMELTLDDANSNKRVVAFRIDDPAKACYRNSGNGGSDFIDLYNDYGKKHLRSVASEAHVVLNDGSIIHGLHTLLYEAAGKDHILQPAELRKYVSTEKNKLQMRPYARLISAIYYPSLNADEMADDEVDEVYGFYKYLRDFTLMPERHIQEVALWQEFMVFAALFNLTEQVGKDLRRINPDLARLDELTARYLARPMQDAVSSFATALDFSISTSGSYVTSQERSYRSYSSTSSSSSRSYDSGSSYDRDSGRGGSSSYSGGGGHRGGGGSGVR